MPRATSTNLNSGGRSPKRAVSFTNAAHIFWAMTTMRLTSARRKMMGGSGRYRFGSPVYSLAMKSIPSSVSGMISRDRASLYFFSQWATMLLRTR